MSPLQSLVVYPNSTTSTSRQPIPLRLRTTKYGIRSRYGVNEPNPSSFTVPFLIHSTNSKTNSITSKPPSPTAPSSSAITTSSPQTSCGTKLNSWHTSSTLSTGPTMQEVSTVSENRSPLFHLSLPSPPVTLLTTKPELCRSLLFHPSPIAHDQNEDDRKDNPRHVVLTNLCLYVSFFFSFFLLLTSFLTVGNHFAEWMGGTETGVVYFGSYPSREEQIHFCREYLRANRCDGSEVTDTQVDSLVEEANQFSLVSVHFSPQNSMKEERQINTNVAMGADKDR